MGPSFNESGETMKSEQPTTGQTMRPYYDSGGITIYHGDSLVVLPTLGESWADAVITDPPYGTKTDQRDEWMMGEHSNIMPLALPLIRASLVGDGAFYCFTSWSMMADWLLRYQNYFKLQNILIWDKGRHSGCYSSQAWQFTWEGIFFGTKGPRAIREYLPDVLHDSGAKREAMEKPVVVLSAMIRASTDVGQTILDPFMGRGGTIVAAKHNGRRAVGIEIEEQYCEIAASRLDQKVFEFSPIIDHVPSIQRTLVE